MRRRSSSSGKIQRIHIRSLDKCREDVNVVRDLLCRPEHGDGTTIGFLLAADRDDVAVQYALRGLMTPLAISTYTNNRALPADIRPALPSAGDLAAVVHDVRRQHTDR